ncbi:hypothetical protein D3C80_945390 [compost metagenome]
MQWRGLAQIGPDPVHIGTQDGRQIGVRHRGVAAPDQLDQGADLMTDRHLLEADLARDLGQPRLMGGEAPAMDQDDGDGPETCRMGRCEVGPRLVFVQRAIQRAVSGDALVDLDHAIIELIVQDDVTDEQFGPGLPADPERIAEPGRDGQQGRLALAFQQGVGRDRGPHPHLIDQVCRQGAGGGLQDTANALDRGVGVLLGIDRQELAGPQGPVRRARHDVGEGAAAIDPETPGHVCVTHLPFHA